MSLLPVLLVIGCIAIVCVAAAFFFRSGFRLLRENFEGMQRSLIVHQSEFERTQETRSGILRSELAQELQKNRQELQLGLSQTTQLLESKLKDLTVGVQTKLELNLKEGFQHFEKVQTHLKNAELQLLNLNTVGQSINELNNLLKLPHLRGNFGEAMLERLLTDLLPVDGFELQYRIVPSSTERVDAVIKYPKSVLPIDSKFPREQVLPLFETNDPIKLEVARATLINVMKVLGKSIKDKYIHPEHGTTDMALLFVPSETLYFEVLRNSKLCEDLAKNKVFAVSPNTLAVTLHSISISRNYYEMAKGIEKTIIEVKRAQAHFENFERRFEEIGTALGKAQTAYNVAQTHLSRYSGAASRLTGNISLPDNLTDSPPALNS